MATLAILALLLTGGNDDPAPDFSTEVRPLLSRSCFACHGPDPASRAAGLRMDEAESAYGPRQGSAAVVPGSRDRSLLWQRIRDAQDPMPPLDHGTRLEPGEIELLGRWIDAGAPYAPHWAFVAPERAPLPGVEAEGWAREPLDLFVLARLEKEDLAPSPEADRWTLARRVALDLTGLPPSYEVAARFAADSRPDAWERYVDELLASPHYGERWAAVWLDLARYADSMGHGSDPLRTIWRYRDWVIEALNANMPYDEFSRRQLAGDLLPDAALDDRLATAFHRNTMTNTEGGTDDEEFRVAAVKDRVNTTMQVWMGLTAGCAECHDHKFDPVSRREYYQLFDYFNHTVDADNNDDSPKIETPTREQKVRLAALVSEIQRAEAELADPARVDPADVARWETQQARLQARWEQPVDLSVATRNGTVLERLDDGALATRGEVPVTDVYELTFESTGEPLSGLRLDALADPELPGEGPGHCPGNGNFVLNELVASVQPSAPTVPRARYVRVELWGSRNILSLAEVEVLSGGINCAPSGEARQSSTGFNGPADLAIDRNSSGTFDEGSVTHTQIEDDPWWELDLGLELPIEEIRLWNRTDGELESRLRGCVVRLLDHERQPVWATHVREEPRPNRSLLPGHEAVFARVASASADHQQEDFGISQAGDLDLGERSGWAVAPQEGRDHQAVFVLDPPLPAGRVQVELHQTYGHFHLLGRLRLWSASGAAPAPALPLAVADALRTPAGERSEEEGRQIAAHFRQVDPGLEQEREALARLVAEREANRPPQTPVMIERPADQRRVTRMLAKGNFLVPEDVVQAGVPAALHAWPEGARHDRAGLAEWLMSPDNPLTARVAVNRVWARLFGQGLVRSEEDFGSQGTPPSHPELLDWLAVEFRESGWDSKALLRRVVLSATYRQDSVISAAALERDRYNVLLARGPRVRLEAEMVRDTALTISGLLTRELGGPSVYPPQPEGLWQAAFNGQRQWSTSTGPDRWRRGLYVFLRRTIPYPSMAAFDAPSRELCTVRRISTNTPLQAFVTLNDPVFVECAQALARRLLEQPDLTPLERAELGLREVLGRPADARRAAVVLGLYKDEVVRFRATPEDARQFATEPLGPLPVGADPVELAAWTIVANVLLNQDSVLTKE